jgi:hypothetical protein
MHDIRKPYIRSNYSRDLNSRVEQFETRSYDRDSYDDRDPRDDGPVEIPGRRTRRNIHDMDMYPRRRRDDVPYEEALKLFKEPANIDLPYVQMRSLSNQHKFSLFIKRTKAEKGGSVNV